MVPVQCLIIIARRGLHPLAAQRVDQRVPERDDEERQHDEEYAPEDVLLLDDAEHAHDEADDGEDEEDDTHAD